MKKHPVTLLLAGSCLATTLLLAAGAVAKDQPAPPSASTPAPLTKDAQALALLKGMSDTLAKAPTLSFRARGLVPFRAPTGQYVSLFADSSVLLQRPDKLLVKSRGDLFPNDLYYDGKTVTAIGVDQHFYAQQPAKGKGLEAILHEAQPGSDSLAPFIDLLGPDSYAGLSVGVTSAVWVGRSKIDGTDTDHLAFIAKDVDWEIWIGTADKLPRLMVVAYREGKRQPTFTVQFSEWKPDAPVSADTFTALIPKDATKIKFKPLGVEPSKR